MIKIAIFASGSGTNAENITNYFKDTESITVSLILTNNPNAFVLERAKKLSVPTVIFNQNDFYNSNKILSTLSEKKIDLIVLAGFLWLIPNNLIKKYPNKIINIHPALLPKYGGKGMYGDNVHKAVIANKEEKSGITIHFANEKYDEGECIFQAKCTVETNETPQSLAKKIHKLEYEFFPNIIEQIAEKIK